MSSLLLRGTLSVPEEGGRTSSIYRGCPVVRPAVSEQSILVFDVEENRLRRRYHVWRDTPGGQAAYALCRRYALEKLARGQRFGIAQLVERVRCDTPVAIEKDAAGYRINNSFRAYIARDLIAEVPALKPLIETRAIADVRQDRADA